MVKAERGIKEIRGRARIMDPTTIKIKRNRNTPQEKWYSSSAIIIGTRVILLVRRTC